MATVLRSTPRWLRWAAPAAWALLTTAASLAHWYAWSAPDAATGSTGSLDGACKVISNVAQTVNAPFWFIAWFYLQRFEGVADAFFVNSVGFACWIGVCVFVLAARQKLAMGRAIPRDTPHLPTTATSRRAFLADSILVSGAACAAGVGVYSSVVTPWSLRVARHRVAIRGLPAALDGLRLVQITDTHLGPRIPAAFIREAVELARSLKPDLYLLTGDSVHMGVDYIAPAAKFFAPLREQRKGLIGTLGVLGNHDHYADAPRMSAALQDVGVRMLDNRRLFIDARSRELTPIPRHADCLCIAGVGDLLEGVVDTGAAFRDVPPEMARLLLSHNPDVAELPSLTGAGSPRVDLMISGHTHGGQVRLPLIGSPLIPSKHGQKYAHGLVRGPAFPVLVCAGVGMSLVPVRLGVEPEILELTLTCA